MVALLAIGLQVAALLELRAAAVEISLQNARGSQQAGGDHEAKSGNGKRSKMEERNHRWRSESPPKVYTSALHRSNAASHRIAFFFLVAPKASKMKFHFSSGRGERIPDQSQSESLLASRPSRTRDTPRTNPRPRP